MVKRTLVKVLVVAAFTTVALSSGCLADRRTLQIGSGDDGGTGDAQPRPFDSGGQPGETLPCDPVKQTGCLESRKCSVDEKNETLCADDGTRKTGATCTASPDTCAKGNVCTLGFCRQFCQKNADCTQPSPSGQPNNEPYCAFDLGSFKVCSAPCNPAPAAGPSGCIRGTACVYGNLGGQLLSDCNRKTGFGTNDSPCSQDTDCDDGYLCVTTKCRAYCRNGVDSDCGGGGYTCTSIATGATFGACCPGTGTC